MAKINFGFGVNDARGKIGGQVASKNKSGAYVRRKVTPANPRSPAQSAVRASFASLSQAWSGSLSSTDRAAWISYAQTYPRLDVFGNSVTLTGLNMFLSLNQVLANTANPASDTPPATNVVTPIPFDPTSFVASSTGPAISWKQTAAATGGVKWYVFASRQLPAGRTVQQNDWRYLGVYNAATTGFPATIDVSAQFVAKFGTVLAGQNTAILLATVDPASGLTTVGTILQTTAT